ncbi:hypothetical protein F9C11_20935 [Amycolatopsis sp. VS8301801F10]|uniref:hypothetical protein n=1 Tax=Amycolatopsis sp. VS8301801F10 TaxID=2652442 RepID=UPI0038FC3151
MAALTLARNATWWPFGGPHWITIVFAGMLAVAGFLTAFLVRRARPRLPVGVLALALLLVLAGGMLGTQAILSTGTTESTSDRHQNRVIEENPFWVTIR